MSGYAGFEEPQDTKSDFLSSSFLITQIVNKLATTALVRVAAVSNAGGVSPVGTVDVVPMVHQVDGQGNPTEHGTIHNVPYFRLQGGTDAIILDPKVGDIGVAVFCSRDISAVKRTKAPAAPPSNRRFDWADAVYFGGPLNGTPTQYVQFSSDGITVHSPTKVTISAPLLVVNADTITTTGSITNNGHAIDSTHRHNNSGGTGVGGTPV